MVYYVYSQGEVWYGIYSQYFVLISEMHLNGKSPLFVFKLLFRQRKLFQFSINEKIFLCTAKFNLGQSPSVLHVKIRYQLPTGILNINVRI